MKLTGEEGIAEVGSHEALAYGDGGFQCNRSQYFERMGKTSYGSKAGCADEIINRVGARRTQGDSHTTQGDSHTTQGDSHTTRGDCHTQGDSRTQGDCHTMHDLGIVLANLRLEGAGDGEIHQPHSTVEQLQENQQQQNGEVSKDVIITVIEEDAVGDGLVRLDPPSCDDDEEDGDKEASDEDSETHLLERSPMYGVPARCSTAAWPGVAPGVSETYPDIGCHVAGQRPDMPAHKRGMDDVCQEPIKYFRPLDAGQCSLGGMSGHGVLDEVSSASGSCVKMVRQTSIRQTSGGTVYISEITQPCPGQIFRDKCDNPELNIANCCLDVFSPQPSISAGRNLNSFQLQPGSQVGRDSKKQVNEYQHVSLDLQQRSSHPVDRSCGFSTCGCSLCQHPVITRSETAMYGSLTVLGGGSTTWHGSHSTLHGSSTPLHGSHSTLHGSSTPLHGSHSTLHGSSTPLHGSHSTLHGSPTPLHGSPTAFCRSSSTSHGSGLSLHGPPTTIHRSPATLCGPPTTLCGPPTALCWPPATLCGPPATLCGPPAALYGPPAALCEPPATLCWPPATLCGPPATLCGSPATLCGPPTTLCGPPATLCGPPATLCGPPATLCGPPATLCGPPATLCGSPATLCGSPATLCGSPATLCGSPATYDIPSALFGSPTGLPLSPPHGSPPSSNRSARSIDSGVCSPLSDNSVGCPLQINTVVSSDQDGDSASDDSCIGENITSSSTELNLILEFIQQEMSEEQNQQSQISPPRASNVLLGSRFSSVTSSENMAQHNCPHPRTGIDCSQPRCASHNGLQPASHNGLQHVSYNGLQHASHNGLQHASHNGLQHASHNGLQPASHNGLQHVSHNGLQHVSHNGLQHVSYNGLQHASHNGLQHASQNGLQPASHNGLQHASHNGLQPASHNGICPLDKVPKSSIRGAPEQSLTAITCSSLPVASRQGRTTMAATQGGAVMVPLKLVVITQQAPPPKSSPTHYRPICPRTEKADNPPEQAASSRSQVDHTDPTTSILPAREEQKQHTYSDKKKLQQARRSVADAPIDDLRSVDDDGKNCVHVAVCQTDHPMVRALVERLVRENIADMINAQNLQGQTPLYLATSTNNTKTVTVLVEYGADANLLAESMTSCGNCQKLGAIHCASTKGQKYLDTLKALLAAPGINLDLVNSEGHTALHCAVLSHGKMGMDNVPVNSVSIIQALIHAGADPNIQVQQNGKTALMFALESRDIHLIEKTFQLVEPAKLYTFLKTQAFDGSTCMKIARSLKPSLNPAGQKRLSNCLKPTARRVSS